VARSKNLQLQRNITGKMSQNVAETQQDTLMEDDGHSQPILELSTEQKIRILPGSSETAASFEFEDEDHTLGNALRYIIMRNPAVEFCGYSIPHPSEAKMNVRIQTYEGEDGTTAIEALQKGLDDLMALCDVVTEKFTTARDDYNMSHQDDEN
jgi:DNA-directed RNA polymerase I and III subunit RPAC2